MCYIKGVAVREVLGTLAAKLQTKHGTLKTEQRVNVNNFETNRARQILLKTFDL